MISWGVWNEGRLGIGMLQEKQSINASKRLFSQRDEEEGLEEEKEEKLEIMKPQIVKIPNKFADFDLQK